MVCIIKSQKCFLVLVSLLLLLAACKNTKIEQDTDELSPAAKKVFDKVDSLIRYEHPSQAVTYMDSAFATFKNPGLKDLLHKYSIKVGHYQNGELDTAKATLYADSMLILLKGKEKNHQTEYVFALISKGDVELTKKNYSVAFHYYYEAHDFFSKNPSRCSNYESNSRLGMVKYRQGHYLEAIPYTKLAFSQSKNCTLNGALISRQAYLNTIALCFEKTNRLDSAVFYYNKALICIDEEVAMGIIHKAEQGLAAKGVVYGNMGGNYAKLKQFKQAEKYLNLSIAINDKPGFDQVDVQTAKLKLASMYIQHARFKEADNLLQQLQQTLLNKDTERRIRSDNELALYELRWKYFEKLNNKTEAYKELKNYYNLRDSFNDVNKALKETDFNVLFKDHAQKDKLALLEKDSQIKRNYILAFFIFSFMIVVALILVWRNRRKLKELNNEITTRNGIMQKVMNALEDSQEDNTRMMKIVAHDLRSPISATISIAKMLKMADLSEADMEMVSLMETANKQSLEMISNLININTKENELSLELVRLHLLLEYCVNLSKFKANEKELTLKLSTDAVDLMIDGGKIFRVINNLIANAIKFSPNGSTIEIALKDSHQNVVISVRDEGIGIPAELKSSIFNIYTAARRKGTLGEDSFGLGLAISKQIIDAHKGQIWFESEEGRGSIFFIELIKG